MARLLVLTDLTPQHLDLLRREHDVIHAPKPALRAAAVAEHGATIEAVLTMGSTGLTAAEIAAMPRLSLIGAQGVGYERVDVAAAKARGIVVTNGAGTNAATVADHTFALLLGALRSVPRMDAGVRQGLWRAQVGLMPILTGKKLGVLGMGSVGRQIARRAAGFDVEVGYHARRRAADTPLAYFESALELARWSDILVAALPGGPATERMIDAAVLDALGPQGFLVNVARGSVVDTAALAAALRENRLAGAALDVYDSEPQAPVELSALPNVVLSPHLGGWSQEAMDNMLSLFMDNARRHFAGEPVLTPV